MNRSLTTGTLIERSTIETCGTRVYGTDAWTGQRTLVATLSPRDLWWQRNSNGTVTVTCLRRGKSATYRNMGHALRHAKMAKKVAA